MRIAVVTAVALTACSGSPPPEEDAGAGDAGAHDSGVEDAGSDGGPGDAGPKDGGVYTKRLSASRAVDLLFVVDNSGSMAAEQQRLGAAFPRLVAALSAAEGRLPDLHVGVVSSNAGAAGASGVPGCSGAGDDGDLRTGSPSSTCAATWSLGASFLSDLAEPDGGRARNFDGGLEGAFACLAALGTSGCGFEMHLESAWRALQPAKNPGFYRPDAVLGVVVVADEDDCSAGDPTLFGDPTAGLTSPLGPRTSFRCHEFGVECLNDPSPRDFGVKLMCRPRDPSPYVQPVSRYVSFFRALKADPGRVVVAGFLGDFDAVRGSVVVGPDPAPGAPAGQPAVQRSCFTRDPADVNDGATPAVRLRAFLTAFPERSAHASVCAEDFGGGMAELARLLGSALGSWCIDRPLSEPLECTVAELVGASRLPIARCGSPRAAPCWDLAPDATLCPASANNPTSLALKVDRGDTPAPAGAVTELTCAARP